MPKSDFENATSKKSEKSPLCDADLSISVSAPGKIILYGEHSVVYGKLALAASLGLRTKLTLEEYKPSEITRNSVNVNLPDVNLIHCYQVQDIRTALLEEPIPLLKSTSRFAYDKPELIHHELLLERVENFIKTKCGSVPLSHVQKLSLTSLFYLFTALVGPLNVPLQSFNLTVKTDLTVSSGLGSSASFSVIVAATFLQYAKSKSQKWDSINSSKRTEWLNTYDKKILELISKWAFAAEKIIHGTPSGLDNTICTYGSVVEFRKGTIPKPIELHHKLQALLVNTKVPKDTKTLVAKVASLKQNFPAIVDPILNAMEEICNAALRNLLKLNEITSCDKISLEECQKQVADVYDQIGILSDINQNLLRSLGVSHSSLDSICSTLSEVGLHGKLTGAGGGGYAIAFVPPNFSKVALEGVIDKLTAFGFDAVLTDLGGPGVIVD